MSKDITIKVQGVSTDIDGAEKLQTNKNGSGTEIWVPEDEARLEELTVTENGTYTPGSDIYGFSRVIANVATSSVTGYIDGVEYTVTLDSDGYLVFTEVE